MLVKKSSIRSAVLCIAAALAGCGSGGDKTQERSSPNLNGDPALEQLTPYQADSAYGAVAKSCVTMYKINQSCEMSDIAPIGYNDSSDVTPEDIAKRLLVSHPWMGDNFLAVLHQLPQEMLNLFKPLNAVVLSFDVRPSFYHSATASIYIDPRYLWLTQSQWNDIYQQDDFRNEYQSQLQFEAAIRYLDPSLNYVLPGKKFDATYNPSRTLKQVEAGLYMLLAHELAHANDFLPRSELVNLDPNLTIWGNIRQLTPVNTVLEQSLPLSSTQLHEAAQVSFQGAEASTAVQAMTAETAGAFFEPDGAADFYAYSSGTEDTAMLFEAFMMRRGYDATADVAFLSKPQVSSPSCNDYVIGWGQRDRLAVAEVKARAQLVAEKLLQQDLTVEFSQFSSRLQDLPYGMGWCDAQAMPMASDYSLQRLAPSRSVRSDLDDFIRE